MHKIVCCFLLITISVIKSQESSAAVSRFQPLPLQEQAFQVCVKKNLHDKHYTPEQLTSLTAFVAQKPASFFKGMQTVKVGDLTLPLQTFLEKNITGNKMYFPDGYLMSWQITNSYLALNLINIKNVNQKNIYNVIQENGYRLCDVLCADRITPKPDFVVDLSFLMTLRRSFHDCYVGISLENSWMVLRSKQENSAIILNLMSKKINYKHFGIDNEFKDWCISSISNNAFIVATQKRMFKYTVDTEEQSWLCDFSNPWRLMHLSAFGIAYTVDNKLMARKLSTLDHEICVSCFTDDDTMFFLNDEPYLLCIQDKENMVKLFNMKTNELLPIKTSLNGYLFEFRDDGMYMTMSTEKAINDFLQKAQAAQVNVQSVNSNCNN